MPYPRSPPNSFHRTHSKFVCASPPTEFTEFTEVSGGEYPPTDFTDFHRSRRVWHPCHTHAALRIPSTEPIPSLFAQVLPQNSQNSQKFLAEDILPRISQNTQKLLAEKSLPRNSQMYTEASGGEEPPTDAHRWLGCVGFSHGIHRIHRSFWRRRASHRFHRFHRWLGCVGFCGKIVWWLRGYGRMPYPPNLCISVQSVGEYLAPETSVGSVGSVGR